MVDGSYDYVCRYGGQFIGNLYGAGRGRIWLNNVRCNGTEADIFSCQHDGWGNHTCSHSDDVSVRCNSGIVVIRPMRQQHWTGYKTSLCVSKSVSVSVSE